MRSNFISVTRVTIRAAGLDEIRIDDERIGGGSASDAPDGITDVRVPVLYPARPCPMTSGTTLAYTLPGPAPVRLEIFEATGRRVTRLVDRWEGPGPHQVIWDGRNDRGRTVGSGLYFVRFRAQDRTLTSRLVVAR